MIILNDIQRSKINEAAIACFPQEMCGLLTQDDFVLCPNVHPEPQSAFTISATALAPWAGKIIAIVHSHCREPRKYEVFDCRTPSLSDVEGQEQSGVPWLIVGTEGETCTEPLELPRTPSRNYIGRQFVWFIDDCYTIIQDFYQFEFGITLPPHLRQDFVSMRDWNHLFADHISNYGFVEVFGLENLADGMVLLLDNGRGKSNHLGIYFQGKVLHQGELSAWEPAEHFVGRIQRILKYVGTSV